MHSEGCPDYLFDCYDSPSLFFSWRRNEFDLLGGEVLDSQAQFLVGVRFGVPANPLTPEARQAVEEREQPAVQEEVIPDSP